MSIYPVIVEDVLADVSVCKMACAGL